MRSYSSQANRYIRRCQAAPPAKQVDDFQSWLGTRVEEETSLWQPQAAYPCVKVCRKCAVPVRVKPTQSMRAHYLSKECAHAVDSLKAEHGVWEENNWL